MEVVGATVPVAPWIVEVPIPNVGVPAVLTSPGVEEPPSNWLVRISEIALDAATPIAATCAAPIIGPKIGPNCCAAANAWNAACVDEVITSAILYFLPASNASSFPSPVIWLNELNNEPNAATVSPTAYSAVSAYANKLSEATFNVDEVVLRVSLIVFNCAYLLN